MKRDGMGVVSASGTVGAKVETSATTALPTVPALASAAAFSAATASSAQEALSEASENSSHDLGPAIAPGIGFGFSPLPCNQQPPSAE